MAKEPPDLPGWFTPIDLDAEERRQRIMAIRRRHFISATGLVARYEIAGDPLRSLQDFSDLINSPKLPPAEIVRVFLVDVRSGGFPDGAFPDGFRYYGDRCAVRSLLDLHNFKLPMEGEYSLRPGFAPAEYVLRPSVERVGEWPLALRACRSVWRRWSIARGWPVPAVLGFVFLPSLSYNDNFRRYFRTLSVVEQVYASANGIVERYLLDLRYPGSNSELRRIVAEERAQRGLKKQRGLK